MGKVHPLLSSSSSSSSSCSSSKEAESFTIWMKSLVMQSNGCTIYNQNGQIVYRVENYDTKGCSEVFLMDLNGTVLFTIKKQWFLRGWKGYKSDGLLMNSRSQKPFFQVKKSSRVCEIVVRSNSTQDEFYKLEASEGKSAFKIINSNGDIVAKATRKQTTKGVVLGDDVLSMVIEGEVDHSFIMALVTVYGLMHHKL